MKIPLLILFFSLLFFCVHAQYGPVYSQYMFNGLAINPAYAGSREALSISALHRSQWSGFEGAPVTSTLSANTPLKNEKVALGLLVFHDRYGITSQTGIQGSYAYRITMGKGKLSFGLQGGIAFQQYNLNNVANIQPNDPVFSGSYRLAVPTAGTGIYYYSDKYFAGISVPQLLIFKTHSSLERNSIRNKTYLFTGGYTFNINGDFKVKPSFLLKVAHASPSQIDVNTMFFYKNKYGAGVSYRSSEAWVFLLSFQASRQLNIGYSYDRSFDKVVSFKNGSHEIVLTYDFKFTVNATGPRSF